MSENFKEAIASNVPTLVDFYTTWCGPCQQMHPILEELKSKIGNKARILKINVEQNMRVAAEYQIRNVPTLMIFKNGQPVWRQVGVQSVSTLESAIDAAVNS
jgi:thioredoxin 1